MPAFTPFDACTKTLSEGLSLFILCCIHYYIRKIYLQEIRDHLQTPEAVLADAVVVGFPGGTKVKALGDGLLQLSISTSDGKPGVAMGHVMEHHTAVPEASRLLISSMD